MKTLQALLALLVLLPAASFAQAAPSRSEATRPPKPATAAPAPALATTVKKTEVLAVPAKPGKGRFLLAPKVGLFEPTSRLSGAFFLGAEAGYVTPALEDRLAVVIEVDWVRPRASGNTVDPRLVANDGSYSLGNAAVGVLLSAVYRLEDIIPGLTPYGGLGPGLYLHRTATNAYGNQYIETEGKLGFQMMAGADYAVGPGAAFLEFHYHFTRVDFLSTGGANVGGFLALGAGYRFRL